MCFAYLPVAALKDPLKEFKAAVLIF
jgi:hypothetical protein